MGLWSEPIYVYPENITINFKSFHIPVTIIQNLDSVPNKPTKLSEFIKLFTESSNIWGYIQKDKEIKKDWDIFLKSISSQNPTYKHIQFHFYCSDDNVPFYIQYDRSRNVTELIWFFSNEQAFNDIIDEAEDFVISFNKQKYIKNYSKSEIFGKIILN
jgi:hypothetical protein